MSTTLEIDLVAVVERRRAETLDLPPETPDPILGRDMYEKASGLADHLRVSDSREDAEQ